MTNERHQSTNHGWLIISISLFIASVLLISSGFRDKVIADEVWKQLGLSEADANRNIMYSTFDGHFRYSGAKNAKNIASSERTAVVKELAASAKKYCNSNEFKEEYKKLRERKMPKPPLDNRQSVDVIRAKEKERLETNLKTAEANINSPNSKLRNSIPGRIERTS